MAFPRVVLISGAPLVGKSTLARLLAARLEYACLSTDDLAQAIRSVTTRASHPAFHLMDDCDYREYYISRTVEQLIAEADAYHAALWPALHSLIGAHASWAGPLVLEGWALLPERVAALSTEGVVSVWLIAGRDIMEARLRQDPAFRPGASDEEVMLDHFLARSIHFDHCLRRAAAVYTLPVLEVTAASSPTGMCARALDVLARAG